MVCSGEGVPIPLGMELKEPLRKPDFTTTDFLNTFASYLVVILVFSFTILTAFVRIPSVKAVFQIKSNRQVFRYNCVNMDYGVVVQYLLERRVNETTLICCSGLGPRLRNL